MKPLCLFTLFFLSLCCKAQKRLVAEFDSALKHPVWEFNKQYHYGDLDFIHQDGFKEAYLQDTLLVLIAKSQWIPGNNSKQMDVEVVLSAKTGMELWHEEIPQDIEWVANQYHVTKYGIINQYASNLLCNDLLTGKILWKFPEGDKFATGRLDTYFDDSLVYMVTQRATTPTDTTRSVNFLNIEERDLKTGRIVKDISTYNRGMAFIQFIHNNRIFLSDYDYPICIDATNGNLVWDQKVIRNGHPPSKTWFADYFVPLGCFDDNVVYLIDTNSYYDYPEQMQLVVANINTGQRILTIRKTGIDPIGVNRRLVMDGRYLYWVYEKTDTSHSRPQKVLHKVFMKKLDLSNSKVIWDEDVVLKYLDNDRPSLNLLYDSTLVFLVHGEDMLVVDRGAEGRALNYHWSTDYVARDAKIEGRFIAIRAGNEYKEDAYCLLNHTNFAENPSRQMKIHLLYSDAKNNAYYLVDERGMMVKVELKP